MIDRELPNPFRNGKLMGTQVDPKVYQDTGKDFRRGDLSFIMSSGQLFAFWQCPAKWRAGAHADTKTWSQDFGSWLDCCLLSPELKDKRFAVTPKTYMGKGRKKDDPEVEKPWNRNATVCDEWESEQERAGRLVISHKIDDSVQTILASLKDHSPDVTELIATSDHQVMCMAEYHDRSTGLVVPFKILMDILPRLDSRWPKCTFDLKTSAVGAPRPLDKSIARYGYHLQSAVYRDVYLSAVPGDRTDCGWVVIENTPPYHVPVPWPAMSSDLLEKTRVLYMSALAEYCQCLKTGNWRSYLLPPKTVVYGGLRMVQPEPWMLEEIFNSQDEPVVQNPNHDPDDLIP